MSSGNLYIIKVARQRDITDGLLTLSSAGTQAASTSTGGGTSTSTQRPVTSGVLPSLKSQSSTSSGASSQTSTSAPSSGTPTTTTGPSASNTPVASSSAPSSILTTSSIPSSTPTSDPSSVPIVVTSSSDTPPTSIPSAQTSQSLAPSQSPTSSHSSAAVSFFHNKPAMIATFTAAGVLVLLFVFVLGTAVLRRSRRKGLIKAAMDYSPTTVHFVNNDDGEGGAGSFSRGSDSDSSFEALGRRPSVGSPSVPGPAPAPAPVPLSVPAPREMQGVGTGFASARYAYGSAPAYYDPVRQQPRPQPRPQQQPQRQVRRQQQQDEWPLPPDLPSSDTVRHPSALIPAYHRELAAFNVPFAATTTKTTATAAAKPSQYSADGGLPARPRVSRMSQVPLPPPARFPNALSRVDESPEDVSTERSEDRRNRPRILKVVNG